MSDYNLGTARGVIEIEYKGDGAKRAREDLKGTGKSADTASQSVNKAGRAAAVGGAVIAGGFALAVRSAANFEQRLSAIGAVSGATGGQMDAIRNKALQLGKDTQFSASESASAMEELIKAGLSVEDVLNGAADATVNLAAAGAVSMPEAATISANAMNQFNLTAKDMVGVVDNIAGAANASAIDVSEFGQSLQQVGAVANLSGVSFKDTATAIALMGNAGIKGSDAGTSLKSMFMRLQPTTKKQALEMEHLGLVTKDGTNRFYDQHGKLKSLAQVSGLLQKSLKGMTAEQKQATLQTIFGSDAIRAAAVLSNQGSAGFEKMATSMNKVSAADVAKKRMDNFKGSLEQMKGSLETVGITVGTILLPALRSLVDSVNGLLSGFLSLSDGTQKTIVAIVGAVGAVLLIAAGIAKLIMFVNNFRIALAGLRLAFASTWVAALGPIALVIAAIAAVIVVIVLLWKHSETFRGIVIGVWNAIKSAVSSVVDWFKGVPAMFSSALEAVKNAFRSVLNWVQANWRIIITFVLGPLGLIIALVTKFWPQIVAVFQAGLNAVKAVWNAIWGVLSGPVKLVFGLILAVIRFNFALMMLTVRTALAVIRAVFSAVWNAIAGVVRAVWGTIKGVVMAGANFVRAFVARVWNGLKVITSAVWNGIMAVIRAVWARIGGTVMGAVNKVRSAISSAWNTVRSLTSSIWGKVVSVIGDKISDLVGKVRGIAGKVKDAVSGAGRWLYDAGVNIIKGLIAGIESMISSVTRKLNDLTQKIKDAKGPEEVDKVLLKSNGQIIMRSLIDGFAHEEPLVMEHLHLLTQKIPDAVLADLSNVGVASAMPALVGAGAPALAASAPTLAGVRIAGDLVLRDGKAYISGVALETIDNEDHMAAVRGRMGGTP